MSEPLIRVENVSKKFCRTLKRSLWYGVKDMGLELAGAKQDRASLRQDEFWSLKDISFEVKRGESIGLIGRNGAGKTTLLRLLNGLIKPDQGTIEVRGRMQALIALGAGFNPILSGRENIYVSAALLGIPKSVIDRRFDEIVDFSGIEEFIDSPLQSYSSGMAVRLGFSVAAHMEPDILLLDEVLAVGDIPFRVKCHKKLGEMKEKGIPWILVSHDMGTIRNKTDKAIFLEKGVIKHIGAPDEAISHYLYLISEQGLEKRNMAANGRQLIDNESSDGVVHIEGVKLLNSDMQEVSQFATGESLIIRIDYASRVCVEYPTFGIHIYGADDEVCYTGINTNISEYKIYQIEGRGSVFYKIDILPLLSGIYRIRADVWDSSMGMIAKKNEAAYLRVKGGFFSTGIMYIPHSWDFLGQTEAAS
jgi:lipopolysaccharide transport system ATP-binding protein